MLDELNNPQFSSGHLLDSDEVIKWLNDQACLGWIEDIEVDKFVEKFKKDFDL